MQTEKITDTRHSPPGDVTPYANRRSERRKGERRKSSDRRQGRDGHMLMRFFRLLRVRLLHLEEVQRINPDRRKGDRRHPGSARHSAGRRDDNGKPLLSQEEVRFLLEGGATH